MVGRLKDVIGKLIFDSHSSFLPKKGILEGILVLNEVVDFTRRNSKRLFLFKVDFKKYFDLVSCDYIFYVLKRMNFGDKWIS